LQISNAANFQILESVTALDATPQLKSDTAASSEKEIASPAGCLTSQRIAKKAQVSPLILGLKFAALLHYPGATLAPGDISGTLSPDGGQCRLFSLCLRTQAEG